MSTRRVLQAVGDQLHEGEGRFAQLSHAINAECEEGDLLLFACSAVEVNLFLIHNLGEFLHSRAQRCCPNAASPVDIHCVSSTIGLEGNVSRANATPHIALLHLLEQSRAATGHS